MSVDAGSGVKVYDYTDGNGMGHHVWYGDWDTMTTWMGWLRQTGASRFGIWRLGD